MVNGLTFSLVYLIFDMWDCLGKEGKGEAFTGARIHPSGGSHIAEEESSITSRPKQPNGKARTTFSR